MPTATRDAAIPEVAIVFVCTDEGPLLMAALSSLYDSEPGRELDVVVVDNASTDGTGDEVRRLWPGARVIRRDRRHGLSDNVNAGIRASRSPLVMVCNSDIVFRPGAVSRLACFLRSHADAGMVAPRLISPEGETWPTARRWYSVRALLALRCPWVGGPTRFGAARWSMYDDWDYASPRAVDWVLCAATMVRRAALDDVGLMDPQFRIYFGDVDLALRMHDGGWEVWCDPEAEVVHLWRRASRRVLSGPWFSHLASLGRFAWKHRGLHPRHRRRATTSAVSPP